MAGSAEDDWEFFQKHYNSIVQKLDVVKPAEEVFSHPTALTEKDYEVPCHVSTITTLFYLSSEVDTEKLDTYAIPNKDSITFPNTTIRSIIKHTPEESEKKPKQTGFYYFTTYNLTVLDRKIAVKVFRNGMLHCTGLQSYEQGNQTVKFFQHLLKLSTETDYTLKQTRTVMINTNFDIGFKLKRNVLQKLFKNYYGIHASFDPCTYPGVLVKLLWNEAKDGVCHCETPCLISATPNKRTCVRVSVSIFGTGKFNISGAQSWEHVKTVSKFIIGVLKGHQSDLKQ
jgi:TATA-box binding protein (TBP) (component of TFIID and TFIIIB)